MILKRFVRAGVLFCFLSLCGLCWSAEEGVSRYPHERVKESPYTRMSAQALRARLAPQPQPQPQPQPPQQLSDEQAVASILQKRWKQISEERSWAQFSRRQDREQIWTEPDIFEEFGNIPGISPEVDQLMGLSNIPLSDFELNAILAQPQPPQQLSDEQAVASILQKRWEQISEERSWAQFLRQQDHEQIWKKPDIFEEFGNSPGISPEEDQLEVDQLMGLSNIPLSDFELNAMLAQPQPPQQLSDRELFGEQISEERSWAQFLRQQALKRKRAYSKKTTKEKRKKLMALETHFSKEMSELDEKLNLEIERMKKEKTETIRKMKLDGRRPDEIRTARRRFSQRIIRFKRNKRLELYNALEGGA